MSHLELAKHYQDVSQILAAAAGGPVNGESRHHLERARVYALMAQNEIELAKLDLQRARRPELPR